MGVSYASALGVSASHTNLRKLESFAHTWTLCSLIFDETATYQKWFITRTLKHRNWKSDHWSHYEKFLRWIIQSSPTFLFEDEMRNKCFPSLKSLPGDQKCPCHFHFDLRAFFSLRFVEASVSICFLWSPRKEINTTACLNFFSALSLNAQNFSSLEDS